jgi:hypothetical protein
LDKVTLNKTLSTTTSLLVASVVLDVVATTPFLIPILIILLPISLLIYGIATLLVIFRCRSAWKALLEQREPEENGWSQFSKSALRVAYSLGFFTAIVLTLKSLDLIDRSVALSNLVAVVGIFFMIYFFRFLGAALVVVPFTLLAFFRSSLSKDRRRCLLTLGLISLSLLSTVAISPDSLSEIMQEPFLIGLAALLGTPYGLAVGSHLATTRDS